jgi:Papain-like cysteine protease AvrRpt2
MQCGDALAPRRFRLLAAWPLMLVLAASCARSNAPGLSACTPPAEYALMPPNTTSPVPLIGQEQLNWCWAASGQMVAGYFGTAMKQCMQVSERYPALGDCCAEKVSKACAEKTGWPQFCKHGLDGKIKKNLALSWDELKQQVYCRRNPVAFTWRWADGQTGHMMVAFGYGSEGQDSNSQFLWVRNPLPVGKGQTEKIFYWDYRADLPPSNVHSLSPFHTHWDDFYDFQQKQDVVCTSSNSE